MSWSREKTCTVEASGPLGGVTPGDVLAVAIHLLGEMDAMHETMKIDVARQDGRLSVRGSILRSNR